MWRRPSGFGPSLALQAGAPLVLNGIEQIRIGDNGPEIVGDPRKFILAPIGRLEPSAMGLDPTIDVYADEKGSSVQPTLKPQNGLPRSPGTARPVTESSLALKVLVGLASSRRDDFAAVECWDPTGPHLSASRTTCIEQGRRGRLAQ